MGREKAGLNLAKHRVDLIDAAIPFEGRPVFWYPSPRDGELRFVTVGVVAEVFPAAIWTSGATPYG